MAATRRADPRVRGCAAPTRVAFGDRVMVLMLNRSEYVRVVLGANLIGAIAVPVNFRMAPAESASSSRTAVRGGSSPRRRWRRWPPVSPRLPGRSTGSSPWVMRMRNQLAFEDLMAEDASDLPDIDVPGGDRRADHVHLGQQTGKPKGAMLTHQKHAGPGHDIA